MPSKHILLSDYQLEFNIKKQTFKFQSKKDPYKLGNILTESKMVNFNNFSEELAKKLIERVVVIFSTNEQ